MVVGVGSLVMLATVNWIQQSLIQGNYNMVRLTGEVQTRSSIAHLWVEEMVEGDHVDRKEIAAHLQKSKEILGLFDIPETDDTGIDILGASAENKLEVKRQTALAKEHLARFSEISRQRERGYDAGEYVQIGSPIDQAYDKVFRELLTDLQSLEDLMKKRLTVAEERSENLFQGILVIWVGIIVLSTLGMWNRERRRQEAEKALRHSEAQLLQSQKLEAVGRLSGGIAHDINNHLAAITAQCDLVRMTGEVDEALENRLDAITLTATKSTNLIKRLLAFSRQQPVIPEVVNVNRAMDDLGELLGGLIGDDVAINFELEGDLGLVLIDLSQLEQVIVNLVVNAREAMPMGGQIQISTRNLSQEETPEGQNNNHEGWILLSVSDTGQGIPEDCHDSIFEPFFTTKDKAHGSGLGLSTVHGIVSQNGGTISVESEALKGATFRVYLPQTSRSETRHDLEDIGVRTAPRVQRGSAGILLVEDDDDVRRTTHEILNELGYQVTTASNAEKAVQLYDALDHPVDLLVTDVIMPGMDGKKLADILRERAPGLRVLFVSGYTDDVVLNRGISRGEEDFLPKPFSALGLANKISGILSRDDESIDSTN